MYAVKQAIQPRNIMITFFRHQTLRETIIPTLAICWAGTLLRLLIQAVQSVDRVVVQLFVYLPLELGGEPGTKSDPRPLGKIPLDENLPAVCLGECCCSGVVCHHSPQWGITWICLSETLTKLTNIKWDSLGLLCQFCVLSRKAQCTVSVHVVVFCSTKELSEC